MEDESKKIVMKSFERMIGTEDNPVKIEKYRLFDGSIFTGEALLSQNGSYIPHGFGRQFVSSQLECYGNWVYGNPDGVFYMNAHSSMVMGHFSNCRPNGWCLSIQRGKGFVFGVFKDDDCVCSLGDSIKWMMKNNELEVRLFSKKKAIFIGELTGYGARGFYFCNNGDLFVGADFDRFNQTGYFFKFSNKGNVEMGLFENGALVLSEPPEIVLQKNGVDSDFYKVDIDTSINYFKF